MADRIYKYSIFAGRGTPEWERMFTSEEMGAIVTFRTLKDMRDYIQREASPRDLLLRVIEYRLSSLDQSFGYVDSWFFI